MSDINELHPWRIISSFLFNLGSDEVCNIIDLSGLQVDWNLNEAEAYSHRTRKRAYLPRVQNAYESLSEDDKLRVAWIVANELAQGNTERASQLNERLLTIGWKLDEGRLTTEDRDIQEMFFSKGTEHDAYVEIRNIFHQSTKSVTIVDPYVDGTFFTVLSTIPAQGIVVKILSFNLPKDISLEAQKFLKQHAQFTLEIRTTKEFHDRFIIIDESKCYHVGASIKDAGNKAFMINEIQDDSNVKMFIAQYDQSWKAGQQIKI